MMMEEVLVLSRFSVVLEEAELVDQGSGTGIFVTSYLYTLKFDAPVIGCTFPEILLPHSVTIVLWESNSGKVLCVRAPSLQDNQ